MKKPVFVESIRIENGIIFNLDLHQERLQKTAFFHYGTQPEIKIDVSSIPTGFKDQRIKCRLLYHERIFAIEFHTYQLRKIKSLRLIKDNRITYPYKSAERSRLDDLFLQRGSADDIIILKNNFLTDSSFSNLVLESFDGRLVTPSPCLLAGVRRQFLLRNKTITEQKIVIDELVNYKKIYLINALIGLEDDISVPITSVST
ncbi:MAG: aminotransferase class IV [Bacteroidia bacterium]|nr:aminotransferase class IV [Bacteroidia bacterium]MCZ2277634.1 aminotransferase class IV [Bacteroidia bacterium]